MSPDSFDSFPLAVAGFAALWALIALIGAVVLGRILIAMFAVVIGGLRETLGRTRGGSDASAEEGSGRR